jgi:hypothetical protein
VLVIICDGNPVTVVCVLELMHSAFISHDSIVQEYITFMFMVQQLKLLTNVHPLLFSLRVSIRGTEHMYAFQ